jgi:hypothetical protein
MNTNKFLIGGIIGGIANFFLGWVVWGMLLMNFMKEHTSDAGNAVMRADADMIWWAMIAGNLAFGFLLSYILVKGNAKSVGAGATMGAVVGLLSSIGMNLINHSLSTSLIDSGAITAILVAVAASTVLNAVVGGIIGWYLGMGKKAA